MAMLRPRHWMALVALAALAALTVFGVQVLQPAADVRVLAFWTAIAFGMTAAVVLEVFAVERPESSYPAEDHRGVVQRFLGFAHRDHTHALLVLWAVALAALAALGFLGTSIRSLEIVLALVALAGAVGFLFGDLAERAPKGRTGRRGVHP